MSFIRVYEIATFYTMFQLEPVGKKAHCAGLRHDAVHAAAGSDRADGGLPEPHPCRAEGSCLGLTATSRGKRSSASGACVNAPMVQIWSDYFYEDLTHPRRFEKIHRRASPQGKPVKPGQPNGRQLLRTGRRAHDPDRRLDLQRRPHIRPHRMRPPYARRTGSTRRGSTARRRPFRTAPKPPEAVAPDAKSRE
jgi:hypothetical protein